MLISNPRGGYSFLKGGKAYSGGVIAAEGFAIEHVRLARPVAWKKGFDRIDSHLHSAGRPRNALCAIGLRSPKPFSMDGFSEFNAGYTEQLRSWDILADGKTPVARTNVAPELEPPSEPSLYSFAYTVPAQGAGISMVVSGAGEMPEGSSSMSDVVRLGQTSVDAMREKALFVLELVEGRLTGLGATWNDVTVTNIYTVHDVGAALAADLLPKMGRASGHGVCWYHSRPPIVSIEFEMDVRGCARESVLEA